MQQDGKNKRIDLFGLFTQPTHYFIPKQEKSESKKILHSCHNSYPLSRIVGPNGSGRTAAAFWIYQTLPFSTHEVLYLSRIAEGDEQALLRHLLDFMGYDKLEGLTRKELFKKLISEIEEIHQESRQLLVILDDPDHMTASFFKEQIEPLLALNKIQENSIAFLVVLQPEQDEKLSTIYQFDNDARLQKHLLQLDECRDYLATRLKGSFLADFMLADEELQRIHQKSGGKFSRINELAAMAFSQIARVASQSIAAPDPEGHFHNIEKTPSEISQLSSPILPPKQLGTLQEPLENDPISRELSVTDEQDQWTEPKAEIVKPQGKEKPPQAEPAKQSEEEFNNLADDSWKVIESLLKSS